MPLPSKGGPPANAPAAAAGAPNSTAGGAESVVLEEEYDENYEPTAEGEEEGDKRPGPPAVRDYVPEHEPVSFCAADLVLHLASPEIEEYAQFLGIDTAKERHLLWVAREGLKAPLPPDWRPW
ncbi:MAG: hypothetical protein BJ554DRAFT_1606 [Olpidium bornovanus]|uniref:Uncharacterized protein n=1 Tax=Olpidium bornovanus TaxID=278681 RepID=A0A8H7ZS17_9FUNG|nr:MAG: hypothetical protein BJ554DRAFT_1606 [Olpidium bornovanus]